MFETKYDSIIIWNDFMTYLEPSREHSSWNSFVKKLSEMYDHNLYVSRTDYSWRRTCRPVTAGSMILLRRWKLRLFWKLRIPRPIYLKSLTFEPLLLEWKAPQKSKNNEKRPLANSPMSSFCWGHVPRQGTNYRFVIDTRYSSVGYR